MEPAINNSLSSDPDLTVQFFGDVGWFGASAVEAIAASGARLDFSLGQSMPNPGVNLASVRFSVPDRGRVVLRVFDVNGRLVKTPVDETLDPGAYSARIETAGLAGGVYFYRLEAGGKSLSRRLAVLP
jgi:hypothetical protein